MSHTFIGSDGARFMFNSDFAGTVIIGQDTNTIEISGNDMGELFGRYWEIEKQELLDTEED